MSYLKPSPDTAIATTVRLPTATLRQVDLYCEAKQISRSALFRKLIAAYQPIKQYQPKKPCDHQGVVGAGS